MRVQWQDRRGGGVQEGVCVITGMCVNYAPPPINQGRTLGKREDGHGGGGGGGQGKRNKRNGKINRC